MDSHIDAIMYKNLRSKRCHTGVRLVQKCQMKKTLGAIKLNLRGKSNARSDCKGPCPVEFQISSRKTWSHSLLKRLGFFATILVLIC